MLYISNDQIATPHKISINAHEVGLPQEEHKRHLSCFRRNNLFAIDGWRYFAWSPDHMTDVGSFCSLPRRTNTTRHRAVTVACEHQGRIPPPMATGTDGEQHAADYHCSGQRIQEESWRQGWPALTESAGPQVDRSILPTSWGRRSHTPDQRPMNSLSCAP